MSKSINLIGSAIKIYQEHMGLVNTLKQEVKMEQTKMPYQDFSLEIFDRPQIEFQGGRDFLYNLPLTSALQEKGNSGILTPKQWEALNTLRHLCGEMGCKVELGDLPEISSLPAEVAIPIYITIDEKNVLHSFAVEDYSFPEFSATAAEFMDHHAQELKALPLFEEGVTLDSFFHDSFRVAKKEKVRIKIKGGGHE